MKDMYLFFGQWETLSKCRCSIFLNSDFLLSASFSCWFLKDTILLVYPDYVFQV